MPETHLMPAAGRRTLFDAGQSETVLPAQPPIVAG